MKNDGTRTAATERPVGSGKKGMRPAPERHRWLDAWLVARGEPLRALVRTTETAVARHEDQTNVRQKARRPDDAAKHKTMIDVVVSNLAYAVLVPPRPTGRIAVRKGGRLAGLTRYDNRALGSKPMRRLLHQLAELDFLSLTTATQRGEVSSIAPTNCFCEQVRKNGIAKTDFGRDVSEELILLARKRRFTSNTGERWTHREQVDYSDTAETQRLRDELRALNRFLASADIDFLEDGLEPSVDAHERRLRRHFTVLTEQPERFDQCGRLFGGFWLAIKSARRRNIRINGEPVADLDFATMFTRLAYARLKAVPPDGDLYAIPGTEGYRSGVKLAMNALLFDDYTGRRKWPKELGVGVGTDADARDPGSTAAQFDGRLPAGWTVGRTRTAILKRHPRLGDAWGRSLGHQLMHDESRVLLTALNRLMTEGVPALGMHDGLLVQRSKRDLAKAVMEQAARDVVGLAIPVEEKG